MSEAQTLLPDVGSSLKTNFSIKSPPTLFPFPISKDHDCGGNWATSNSTSESPQHFWGEKKQNRTKQNKLENKLLINLPPPTLFSFPVCNDHESSENRATSKSTSEAPPHFERNFKRKTKQTNQQHNKNKTNKLESKFLNKTAFKALFRSCLQRSRMQRKSSNLKHYFTIFALQKK